MTEQTPRKTHETRKDSSSRGFRKDIQGLRAVAVSLVVIYHLWPTALTGGFAGVDVFFVISGFLITAHLLSRPPQTGRDLGQFWARRIRRLLPAALTVLAVTAVGTRLLAPSTQWMGTAKEIIASALYVQNWRLATSAVDYLAEDNAPSPVQHYWSLSIEEQFYLIWPLLMFAAFFIARRYHRNGLSLARGVILAMVVVSLAYSVYATASSPSTAYFITPTRMWELAAGGLVATFGTIAASRFKAAAAPVAWLGLAAVVITGFTYTGATPFPGYTALLPVMGTAAVILAGSDHPLSPLAIFRFRPVQWLGDVSYSVYLWHWPLIILVPFVSGGSLGILDKSAILVVTLVLAGLSKTFIEDRFRQPKPGAPLRHSYRVAVVGMVLLSVLGSAQIAEAQYRTDQAAKELEAATSGGNPCLGAGTLAKGAKTCPAVPEAELVPSPELAKEDRSAAYADKCWTNSPFTGRKTCTYGDGPKKVALVGNSHAGHWLPALEILAKKNGWTITTYLVSACAVIDAPQTYETKAKVDNCHAYGQWAQKQTSGNRFDLVIMSNRLPLHSATRGTSAAEGRAGYERYLRTWAKSDTNVLAIKDPSYPGVNVPDCLAENPDDQDKCSAPRKEWIVEDPIVAAVKAVDDPRITSLDLDDLVCEPTVCRGANGGVITYFDKSHLSATYVETMAPYMAKEIEAAVNR
ncbi:acyltransferase family protein [Janibacter limosus]|uniref:acyltransferase family protein n=1 Tax=Janibacter limosus TaxID=53458 RepID=UPI0008323D99|nr:acyltransferase family protein [Janibacter limosus]